MNIIELIQKLLAYIPVEDGIKTEYGKNDDALFMLDQVKEALKKYEKEKYPAEFFEYRHFYYSDGESGSPFQVRYVKTIKPLHLSEEATKNMAMHAYKVRQLSIIAGILYAIHTSQGLFLNLAQETARNDALKFLDSYITAIYNPNLEEVDIETFITQLATTMAQIANVKQDDALNEIRIAERYFVADYNKNTLFLNETTINDIHFFQLDNYFTTLTDEQKSEFIKIKTHPQPDWFTYLKSWEQRWLQTAIPDELDGDWSYFESLSQSSAMSQIPGIQNARMNYLVKFDGEKYEVLANGFRTGTMVPYEMRVDKEEMFYHTEANAFQVLSFLENFVANKNIKSLWENIDLGSLKPVIFVQSLLSDVAIAQEDRALTKKQQLAVKKIALETRFPNATILTGNDPLNGFRHIAALNGYLSKAQGRWKYSDLLLDYAKKFIDRVSSQTLSPLQQKNLDLIKEAAANLKKLKSTSHPGRNFSAYKVAYSTIIAEKTGGITTLNCKSGKDRTGLVDLYILTMYIYFDLYNCLPEITDTGSKREKFNAIFIFLFNMLRAQALAANNTPGSFGLKLDPTMLCDDIEKALKDSGTYKPTIYQANLNKPQEFIGSEVKETRVRANSTKSLRKGSSPIIPRPSTSNPPTPLSPRNVKIDEMDKELAELRGSTLIAPEDLKNTLSVFGNFKTECQETPELIPHWQFAFKKIKKTLKKIEEIKTKFQELREEFTSKFPNNPIGDSKNLHHHTTIAFLQMALNNDNLFLKCNGDIIDVIERAQLISLPTFVKKFKDACKEIEAGKKQVEEDLNKKTDIESPPSSQKRRKGLFGLWGRKKDMKNYAEERMSIDSSSSDNRETTTDDLKEEKEPDTGIRSKIAFFDKIGPISMASPSTTVKHSAKNN
ncbi:MAG: hypothetical protein LCH30_03590 [Proteobacteria bacterium]|nr:hypothetical protein [Pseudomonadota bacterium]